MSYRTNEEYKKLMLQQKTKLKQLGYIQNDLTEIYIKKEYIRLKHLLKTRVCSTPYREVANYYKEKGYQVITKPSHYTIFPLK